MFKETQQLIGNDSVKMKTLAFSNRLLVIITINNQNVNTWVEGEFKSDGSGELASKNQTSIMQVNLGERENVWIRLLLKRILQSNENKILLGISPLREFEKDENKFKQLMHFIEVNCNKKEKII